MVETQPLHAWTASAIVAGTHAGTLSAEAVARACLDRIAARDPALRAWVHTDPAQVLAAARELDKRPDKGPLCGVPIGVKDMIQTADMPTQNNSPLYAGHQPGVDAACVQTLRAAGALIFGKTDTVEFAAAGRRALTRNPHDPARTPGGSSSGSAAAVADLHVPIALGTQTGGSLIRPASFCGLYALKPSWGVVSREGAKLYSLTCDTIGWYGRSADDLGLIYDVFAPPGDEPAGATSLQGARFALCRTPMWDEASAETQAALATAANRLKAAGATVELLELPPAFGGLVDAHKAILAAEGRAAFLSEYRAKHDILHTDFRAIVENHAGITRSELRAAYDLAAQCRMQFDILAHDFHAVLVPSAVGEAPLGLASTGDSVFNRMWTLLHAPCINVPGCKGPNGLPVGVTLTGPRFSERALLGLAGPVGVALAAEEGEQR
jgi:Asp-tRNA(Asn)/Glu-tRNA(Gln) amidotransferase A subunit family amidase